MGYDADRTRKTGTYFLKTNSNSPFCGKSARYYSYVLFRLATNSQKAKLPAVI